MFWLLDKLQLLQGYLAVWVLPWMNGGIVRIPRRLRAVGIPLIRACRGAIIEIEDNVTLHSSNLQYHAQMLCSVKLLADRPGASIKIGSGSRLNGACVHAWDSVKIGRNCLIAANVQIIDANGHAMCMDSPIERLVTQDKPSPIVIGDNVWIGLNSIILPGTELGDGCVVAAGSVVKGKFGSGSVLGGVPARVIQPTA